MSVPTVGKELHLFIHDLIEPARQWTFEMIGVTDVRYTIRDINAASRVVYIAPDGERKILKDRASGGVYDVVTRPRNFAKIAYPGSTSLDLYIKDTYHSPV